MKEKIIIKERIHTCENCNAAFTQKDFEWLYEDHFMIELIVGRNSVWIDKYHKSFAFCPNCEYVESHESREQRTQKEK